MSKRTVDPGPHAKLPEKHVAILFEGAWMFSPDPEDSNRVLAVCPYEDAPNHVCAYDVWQHAPGVVVMINPELNAEMEQGNKYRVDLEPARESQHTYSEVFEQAAAKYGIIYVSKSGADDEVTLDPPQLARRISIPMPDEIRAAGKLRGATISLGDHASKYQLGIDGKPVSLYVTMIFFYNYTGEKPEFNVTCSTGAEVTPLSPAPTGLQTHLVIRVYAPSKPRTAAAQQTGPVGVEDDHFTQTFELLRNMIAIQPRAAGKSGTIRPDFQLEPPTKEMVFEKGDTKLSLEELGLANGIVEPDTGDLAACAGGVGAISG